MPNIHNAAHSPAGTRIILNLKLETLKTFYSFLLMLLCSSAMQAQINKEYFFYKGTNELIDRKYPAAIESFNLLLKVDTGIRHLANRILR